jgi:hypothetical protein
LKYLYLAHLSRECNKPELAQHVMAEQLHHIGATHVRLQLAAQDVPCETLELCRAGCALSNFGALTSTNLIREFSLPKIYGLHDAYKTSLH